MINVQRYTSSVFFQGFQGGLAASFLVTCRLTRIEAGGADGRSTDANLKGPSSPWACTPVPGKLVAIAKQRDGSDNISVRLIRVRGVERVGMYRGRPYKLR